MNTDIFIIYYVFIKSSNDWKSILIGQLQDILASKILYNDKVIIDIVLSAHSDDAVLMAKLTIDNFLIQNTIRNYNIIFATDNNFVEYPGIYQLYKRGCQHPESICLYLHTKGMFFHGNNGRQLFEVQLTRNILNSWKNTINILEKNKHINKATIACSKEGWGWFNFFWVKSSYLAKCKEPTKDSDRYYYEAWLGRYGSNTYEDCYNIISPETKHYDPATADILLKSLKI